MLEQRKLTLALIEKLKDDDDWKTQSISVGQTCDLVHMSGIQLSKNWSEEGAARNLRFWQRRRVAKAVRRMLCRKAIKQLESKQ